MNKCSEKEMHLCNLTFLTRQNFFFLPNLVLETKHINPFTNLTVEQKTKQTLSSLPSLLLTQTQRT